MERKFRLLRADEIECRVAYYLKGKGLCLLLYKDARCDQNILDETVGPMNWQRHHNRDNANCIVSIWDVEKKQWIEKEDTGKESFSEAEKGLASDSFKRACFNWGIGRELYTAPFIWIKEGLFETQEKKGKLECKDSFYVSEITYTADGKIDALKVVNKNSKKVVFTEKGGKVSSQKKADKPADNLSSEPAVDNKKLQVLKDELKRTGTTAEAVTTYYGVQLLEDIVMGSMYDDAIKNLKKKPTV